MSRNKPKLTGILLRPASTSSTGEHRSSGRMFYRHRRTDGQIGIVSDANRWVDDPRDLVTAIRRLGYLSAETARIVDGLPNPLPEEVLEFSFELEGD